MPPPSNISTDAAPPANVDAAASIQDDAGPAVAGGNELCRSEWPQTGYLSVFNQMLATDVAGNSYVAIDYGDNRPLNVDAGAPAQLNLGTPPTQVPVGFAVAKFDDACNLVWVREFGPSGAAYSYGAHAAAIGTDAASNVTILGDFFGSVDFGAGTLTAGPEIHNGVLVRLDSTGKTVFSTQFVNAQSDSSLLEDGLAVTPAGVSTIALWADSATDFGNGQDSVNLLLGVTSNSNLVQFDASGKALFRKTVPSINSSLAAIYGLATNASGFLWAGGKGASLVSPSVTNLPDVTMGITASGALAWQQPGTDGSVFAAGPNGAVEYSAGTTLETLQAIASDGSSPWTASTSISGDTGGGNFIIDAKGNPVVAGYFRGTVTFGSAPLLTSAGSLDVDYQVFDASGHLRSAGAWGGPDDDQSGGVGVDPAGNILVGGNTTSLATGFTSRVFLVKLAR